MLVEKNVPLQPYNTFHIVARAHTLLRVASEADVLQVLADPELGPDRECCNGCRRRPGLHDLV